MVAPENTIRIKMKSCRRLLVQQLNRKPSMHARTQEYRRQKNIQKAMHDRRRAVDLISQPMPRTHRMMQSRRRLERHVGRGTQAYEFDDALRCRKLVCRFSARPNLSAPSATRYLRDAVAHLARRFGRPWDFKISFGFRGDKFGEPLDLFRPRNLYFDRLDADSSRGRRGRESIIELADSAEICGKVSARQRR